jgi:DNA-entry nuclease
MKKSAKITQWIFAGIFAICALGNGFHFSSLFLIAATLLMAPIHPIRKFLSAHKIKSWLAILLAVVLLFTGILSSPSSESPTIPQNEISSTTNTTNASTESTTETGGSNISSTTESTIATNDPTQNTQETNPPTDETQQSQKPSSVGSGTAIAVKPSDLPAYSGSPYTTVNNNQPNFSSAELTTTGYEKYSPLDSKGRCGVALASCGKEIMPGANEERGSISSVKPTGWIQAKYDGISGGYLWNRCHLIGWQLSAENANKQNLITGTRYMNINGMLTFENMVADYIKETGNHVAYRVTPIFEGNNLVCSGVQIEAYSIEDNGDGICFNVYCYNVQPNISINYATGESTGPAVEETQPPTTPPQSEDSNNDSGSSDQMVWIPKSGTKYHSHAGCSNMKGPSEVTKEEAERRGYEPCKKCW